jgi:hypothetical protein
VHAGPPDAWHGPVGELFDLLQEVGDAHLLAALAATRPPCVAQVRPALRTWPGAGQNRNSEPGPTLSTANQPASAGGNPRPMSNTSQRSACFDSAAWIAQRTRGEQGNRAGSSEARFRPAQRK